MSVRARARVRTRLRLRLRARVTVTVGAVEYQGHSKAPYVTGWPHATFTKATRGSKRDRKRMVVMKKIYLFLDHVVKKGGKTHSPPLPMSVQWVRLLVLMSLQALSRPTLSLLLSFSLSPSSLNLGLSLSCTLVLIRHPLPHPCPHPHPHSSWK